MKKHHIFLVSAVIAPASFVLAMGHPADAQGPRMSLKERQLWEANSARVTAKAREVSQKCGTTITASFDVGSYRGLESRYLAPDECAGGIIQVGVLCDTALGKSSVQRSVTDITCRRSNDSSTGTKISTQGKHLVFALEPTKAYVVDKSGATTSWSRALQEVLTSAPPASAPPSPPTSAPGPAPGTASAPAEMSLQEREMWAGHTKLVDEKARDASKECGTTITATIDIASYKGVDTKLIPSECGGGITQVGALCRTPLGKSAVQQSVGTITCRARPNNDTGTTLTRQGKALVFTIAPNKAYIVDKKGSITSWDYALREVL